MDTIYVTHAFSDSGNCREYYLVSKIIKDSKEIIPKKMLICSQDEGQPFGIHWYRTSNDGIWFEPESVINPRFTIKDENGEILR